MAPQGAPYAVWNDNDHSGPVIIVTSVCMFYWLIPGVVQQAISLLRHSRLMWADGFFAACGVVQSSLLLVACHHGLGRSKDVLQPDEEYEARRLYYMSNILLVLTLGIVKCASALFVCNLTVKDLGSLQHAPRRQRCALYLILALIIAWAVYAVVWLALPCSGQIYCVGTVGRWLGVFIGDAVTDVAIAVFAAAVIWPTKATVPARVLWYLPFCLRFLLPLLSGLRLLTLDPEKFTADPTLMLWQFIVLSQIQLLLSIIGGATPALKKTMLDLVTNYGALSDSHAGSRAGYGGSNSLPLRYVGRSAASKTHISSHVSSTKAKKLSALV